MKCFNYVFYIEGNALTPNYTDANCAACYWKDVCHRSTTRYNDGSDLVNKTFSEILLGEKAKTHDDKMKVNAHKKVCEELNELYARKNHDYGDSFHKSFVEEGMAIPRIMLGDKFNRFKTLTQVEEQLVQTESVRDTLIDLANYAIMTVMEIDAGHQEDKEL